MLDFGIVEAVDLRYVESSLIEHAGVEPATAIEATELYRKYLFLRAKYRNERFPAPALVDEAWHVHILNTERYMRDCERIYGSYLHHDPAVAPSVHAPAWQRTKDLFLLEFGIDLDQERVDGFRVAGKSF